MSVGVVNQFDENRGFEEKGESEHLECRFNCGGPETQCCKQVFIDE